MAKPLQKIFFYIIVYLTLSTNAQVFIKEESSSVVPTAVPETQNNQVTQTVYGFLDFTTTIGNTVMIFLPQSSSVQEIKPSEITTLPPPTQKSNVIETSPSKTPSKKTIEIKPSKTEPRLENKSSEKKTSVVGTVVKVNSQSTPPKTTKALPLSSKVNVISSVVNSVVATPIISTKVQVIEQAQSKITSKVVTASPKEHEESIEDHEEPAIIEGNSLGEPEFEFLSRQPSEFVEETYRVVNLKPSSKFILKHKPASDAKNKHAKKTNAIHPTGLVTKLGGTVIKDGTTTVHETSVIGTFISGKYAQVLQSSSRVVDGPLSPKGNNKISPSPSQRITKTAAPSLGKKHKLVDSAAAGSILDETEMDYNGIKTTRKPTGQPFKLRYNKNRQKESRDESVESKEVTSQPNYKKSQRARSQQQKTPKENTSPHRTNKSKIRRTGRKRKTSTTTASSVHSDDPAPSFSSGKRYQSNRRNKPTKTSSSEQSGGGYSRRAFKPKIQTSTVDVSTSSSLYKFKLNRSPGRWQYKTTPKPRVTIRKQTVDEPLKNESLAPLQDSNNFEAQQIKITDEDSLEGSESVASIVDDEETSENKVDSPQPPPMETLKVEISTPPDFKDIYFEIATIKSPYTFQVGSVKNTRFITVTSTFERSLINTQEPTILPTSSEPLTENILATSSNYDKDNNFLDSSLATLPPIYLASDVETPPLETLTETFSTTHTMLKTHILPIIRGPNDTSSSTLVQTYLVTRMVTATKTLPPMEAYHFNPSKTLNEFNSHLDEAGSEFHLELEYGDQNEQEIEQLKKEFPSDLDLSKIGSNFDISEVDKSKIPETHLRLKKHQLNVPKNQLISEPTSSPTSQLSPEQLQQLALLRLLNPGAGIQPQVITTSRPVIKIETLYESHVIPVTNGPSTLLTTLSKIKGTVTKTEYEIGTSTIAPAFSPQIPQVPIPPVPQNPFYPPPIQPQFSVTSSPVVQTTTVTKTIDKVLKLTFGAKTTRTTVISTTVVPTVLTTYVTASVPVQPTAAFPGFFPAPYPQFPYVG